MNISSFLEIVDLSKETIHFNDDQRFGYKSMERGSSAFFDKFLPAQFIAAMEFFPGTGLRGNHYHKERLQYVYVIEGNLEAYFWLPEDPQIKKHITVNQNQMMIVKPGLAHAFQTLEKKVISIEFSPQPFLHSDDFISPNPFL